MKEPMNATIEELPPILSADKAAEVWCRLSDVLNSHNSNFINNTMRDPLTKQGRELYNTLTVHLTVAASIGKVEITHAP